ncbi:SDR family NAD(P)-dependent oxidoreductase [Pseudonocardia hispaniensis]|uniref:SDR family NAD(P)-dependent oxidoreductase n=1 Tax=Pseudonocardia hispaniensis TaxID=904933 RepID=A0ABW1J847_9PSEU
MSLFSLSGRTALVTGASSGLGVQFVRALVRTGARVVAGARRFDRLQILADELGQDWVLPVQLDVTDESSVRAFVHEATVWTGRLDVLVNNAGVTHAKAAETESTEDLRRILDVNLVGLFTCSREAGRIMLRCGGGSIVNIASALGLVASGRIPQGSYCASKGGVVQLTREMAAQWARKGVRVNAIAPGFFLTELTSEMFEDPRSEKYIERTVPMARCGASHELDGALMFLASDASSYVTGQILAVDGGWTSI